MGPQQESIESCKREKAHELENFLVNPRIEEGVESFNDYYYKKFKLTDETTCGFGCIKGEFLQKFANKKAFAVLYGFFGCIFAATFFHFNATISTIEKRFNIPSKRLGMITAGNDIFQILASIVISYYTGRGHRPRWLAVSALTLALFCIANSLPYFIFGPGDEAEVIRRTLEGHGSATLANSKDSKLCRTNTKGCEEGDIWPQLILFGAQLIAGLSGSLYHTLGVSYADDNIKKSKSPALLCFSLFFRMFGPALGYGLSSYFLKIYINPTLHPPFDNEDPRWLGAWWIGWLVLAGINVIFAFLLGLFPKHLPRALARKQYNSLRRSNETPEQSRASFTDMLQTLKRLFKNPVQVFNGISAVFYYIALVPYVMFLPKYMESVFSFSASKSSYITGGVEMVFSGVGMVASGVFLSRYKPRARVMAGYNVAVGALSVLILLLFAFLGCTETEHPTSFPHEPMGNLSTCTESCHCDFLKYSPVCEISSKRGFASACHAGCQNFTIDPTTNKITNYTSCKCIATGQTLNESFVVPGLCPVPCMSTFVFFMIGLSVLKFANASGRLPNLLLQMRSVTEKDKPVAMAFNLSILSLLAFIPAPILVGSIWDASCLHWDKKCTGNGNCWEYDLPTMRHTLNITAAVFMAIGTLLDTAVWYYSKGLEMFDDKPRQIVRKSNG